MNNFNAIYNVTLRFRTVIPKGYVMDIQIRRTCAHYLKELAGIIQVEYSLGNKRAFPEEGKQE